MHSRLVGDLVGLSLGFARGRHGNGTDDTDCFAWRTRACVAEQNDLFL
jgi:hypothetical protein